MVHNFEDFVKEVIGGARGLARETLGGFDELAVEDASAFIEVAEADLRKWARSLAEKNISEEDFDDLVRGKKALLEICALSREGISAARLEQFRNGLIDLVVDKALGVFV